MAYSFSFKGEQRPYLTILSRKKPYWSPRSRGLLTVPGRAGAYLTETTVEALTIPVDVLIEGTTRSQLKANAEDLVKWLSTEEPAELVFPDEPNRTYYAVLEGEIDAEEIVTYATLTLNFLCPDAHKYGPFRSATFQDDTVTIRNNGSAETYPTFRAKLNSRVTNLDIVTEDAFMRIGQPAPADKSPIPAETVVMDDSMATLTGWVPATTVDNGHVAGNMATDGDGFFAETWGSVMTPAMWQGPSRIKSLPRPVQNFQVDATIDLLNGVKEAGMIEIYALDSGGNVVAKVGFEDYFRESKENRGKFAVGPVGNRKSFVRSADVKSHWNDFRGIIRLKRNGRRFEAYFAKVDARGNHHTRAFLNYDAPAGSYDAPVSQIQVAIRKWPSSDVPQAEMKICRIKVLELNDTTPTAVEYIGSAGDIFEINFDEQTIRKNGELRQDLIDMAATYFPLKPGDNIVSYSPASVDLSVEWRERYS